MRAAIYLGLLLMFSSSVANAMPNPKITLKGKIISTTNEPLEYATVSALSKDSTLIDGTISDQAGRFSLSLPKDSYLLKIEFLGFLTTYRTLDLNADTDLGSIRLSADVETLDEVEVRAEKSQMNLMIDKKVFNIGKDALSRGGSANTVLEQLPSVAVSPEGQVSLRGNSGVRVLINGRPSSLASNNALASIPAESIEKVEIITNPSAKYEAAGNAGIINIILKKEQNQGYGGTASLSVGYPADHRGNLNMNWRKKKFNAFANLGFRYANFFGGSDYVINTTLPGVLPEQLQTQRQKRNDVAFSAYTGLDYNINKGNTFTASYSVYDVLNDDLNTTDYLYSDAEGNVQQDWKQSLDYTEPGLYQQIDFIYHKTFAKEGKKLSVYQRNDLWAEEETEDILILQRVPAESTLLDYITNTKESSADHMLQVDYETPLGEHAKLEMGIRGETRIISADYQADQSLNGDLMPIPGFNNKLDYFERVGAAYFQYQYQKEALGIQLGLRNEYTFVKVETRSDINADIEKRYNRIFPSMSLSYQLSEEKSMQLSYSRRIRRPSFWQLNPFRGLNDPTTLFIGNPDMDPAYTDRIELNYVWQKEKFTINPAIYGSRTIDYFEVAREQTRDNLFGLETGTFTSRPINLEQETQYGVELITSYRPTEAITLSNEFNYYGYQQRGVFGDRNFDFDFATWTAGMRIQVDFQKEISFQASLNYNARRKTVQMLQKANYGTYLSLSKQWNKKLTLTLSGNSPQWWEVEIFRPSFILTENGRWVGWRAMLTLQYRFEQGAEAAQRRNRGSIR